MLAHRMGSRGHRSGVRPPCCLQEASADGEDGEWGRRKELPIVYEADSRALLRAVVRERHRAAARRAAAPRPRAAHPALGKAVSASGGAPWRANPQSRKAAIRSLIAIRFL
jgi:hypothetical protein